MTAADFDPTPAMRAHDHRVAMAKTDPLLALAYFCEAAGDRRIENDVTAIALLADIRDRAREAVTRHNGAPFFNPLYR